VRPKNKTIVGLLVFNPLLATLRRWEARKLTSGLEFLNNLLGIGTK
jgi:hypothetical protein